MNQFYRSIAIFHKYPNLKNGYDFELYNEKESEGGKLIFNWLTSEIPKPSDSDLQKWFKEHEALQYQRDRASAYPSIQDVVVALAEKEEGNDTMWQEITAQRAKVKADNPKPE